MSNITYRRILTAIESFSSEHLQVKKFASDFPEQLPNFATTDEAYPILFVSPSTSTFNENTNKFELTIYCYDVIQKDRKNINTVLSDTNQILNDLVLWLKDGDLAGIDLDNQPTLTAINNDLLDYVAGWQMNVTLDVSTYTVCEIPFNEQPAILDEVNNIIYSRYLTCETLENCDIIQDLINNVPNLQQVTDIGNTTTHGIFVDNPYGSSNFATPYFGGSPQFSFYTSGDGVEFPYTKTLNIYANVEEYFNLQTSDGDGSNNSMSLTPYYTNLYYSGVANIAGLNLNDNGVGLQTNTAIGYLRTDILSGDRTYQFPDANGTLALLSDIPTGSTTPTLEQVTTAGNNVTDKYINFYSNIDYNNSGGMNHKNVYFSDSSGIYSKLTSLTPNGLSYLSSQFGSVTNVGFSAASQTNNIYFPNASGTLALLSDIQSSELQKLTEGGQTGWRVLGRNTTNFGNIGSSAIDFSNSTSSSTTKGATGGNAFAANVDTTASGLFSFAINANSIASGTGSFAGGQNTSASNTCSVALGFNTTASGIGAVSIGQGNTAPSWCELVVGNYATNYTAGSDYSYNSTDRAFNVGNGLTSGERSDAFTIYKNGVIKLFPTVLTGITNASNGILTYNNSTKKLASHNGTIWDDYTTTTDLLNKADKFYTYKLTSASSSVTGTLSETELVRIPINGNSFFGNDIIKIPSILLKKTGTNGAVAVRLKISTSATMPIGVTGQIAQFTVNATSLYQQVTRTFYINGGQLKGFPFTTASNSDIAAANVAMSSVAFDNNLQQYLYISAALLNTADSLKVEGMQITNY